MDAVKLWSIQVSHMKNTDCEKTLSGEQLLPLHAVHIVWASQTAPLLIVSILTVKLLITLISSATGDVSVQLVI